MSKKQPLIISFGQSLSKDERIKELITSVIPIFRRNTIKIEITNSNKENKIATLKQIIKDNNLILTLKGSPGRVNPNNIKNDEAYILDIDKNRTVINSRKNSSNISVAPATSQQNLPLNNRNSSSAVAESSSAAAESSLFLNRRNVARRNTPNRINGRINGVRAGLIHCNRLPSEAIDEALITTRYLCDSHHTKVFSYLNTDPDTPIVVKGIFDTGNSAHTIIDEDLVNKLRLTTFPILATKFQIILFNNKIDEIIYILSELIRSPSIYRRIESELNTSLDQFTHILENSKIPVIPQKSVRKTGIQTQNVNVERTSYPELRNIQYERTTVNSIYVFINKYKRIFSAFLQPKKESDLYNFFGISGMIGVGDAVTIVTEEVIIPFSIDGIYNEDNPERLKKFSVILCMLFFTNYFYFVAYINCN